jgi:hypothetical protein
MTKDEALDLALEALESCGSGHITDGGNQWHDEKLVDKAITAIKQARALDKMAENARELGLDYEPVWDNLPSNKDVEEAMRAMRMKRLQEPVNHYCCHACFTASGSILLDRMILCPQCGNKRCPKASNHRLDCTSSNDPGQPGSVYTTPPAQPASEEDMKVYRAIADNYRKDLAAAPTQEYQINQLEKFKNHVLANADALGVVLDAPVQEPPPECQTEAEKRAYAFGWWKALEANRVAPVQDIGVEQDERVFARIEARKNRDAARKETVQRQWVGLTDEEVADLGRHELWIKRFIRTVEAKLKEKNDG